MTPVTSGDGNKALINPPLDSVQEFSVQAENFNAQFGRSSGALVNMVLKSGTNNFHGLGYDYERHSVTDANTFFNNKNGIALASWSRHQFGGNLGGPVKKGKWFVFGDYEGLRQATPSTAINTVPTAAQAQGNFSQTFASNGSLITVYDPSNDEAQPGGGYLRTAFANNTIPTVDINSVAKQAGVITRARTAATFNVLRKKSPWRRRSRYQELIPPTTNAVVSMHAAHMCVVEVTMSELKSAPRKLSTTKRPVSK